MRVLRNALALLLVCNFLLSFPSIAEGLKGKWEGNIEIGTQLVPVVFNITVSDNQLKATMDSPMQGAKDIPIESVSVSGNQVVFDIAVAGARYESIKEGDSLVGTWKQSGQLLALTMTKQSNQATTTKASQPVKKLYRPQEPTPPFDYVSKEVSFLNSKDGIELSGTLTLPKKPIAAVILVSGSGPQDRNQLFMGHKTFWVLADFLSSNSIAVLRFDDRGVGKSQGVFENSTSYDFSEDVSAGVDFLKSVPELNGNMFGIIGHSEGGLIAPVTANNNANVDFIVLMAGPSQSGQFVSENQMKKILLSNGLTQEATKAGSEITAELNKTVLENTSTPYTELRAKLLAAYSKKWDSLSQDVKQQIKRLGGGTLPEQRIKMLTGNWYKTFLTHKPSVYLANLDIPVLALFGEKDVQVSASEHYELMQQTLKNGHQHSQSIILEGHNHLFQRSETGAMSEYQHIEETLSPVLLEKIKTWIFAAK